jgi:hypothetical protein
MRCACCKRLVGPRYLTETGKCIFCAPPGEWRAEWTNPELDAPQFYKAQSEKANA